MSRCATLTAKLVPPLDTPLAAPSASKPKTRDLLTDDVGFDTNRDGDSGAWARAQLRCRAGDGVLPPATSALTPTQTATVPICSSKRQNRLQRRQIHTDALRIYNEAWRLKQSPDIAANLAQTGGRAGQTPRRWAEHFAFAVAHLLPSSTDEQKKALSDGLEI